MESTLQTLRIGRGSSNCHFVIISRDARAGCLGSRYIQSSCAVGELPVKYHANLSYRVSIRSFLPIQISGS